MTQRTTGRESPIPYFAVTVRGYDGTESVWRCTIPKHIAADGSPAHLSEALSELGPIWLEELRLRLLNPGPR